MSKSKYTLTGAVLALLILLGAGPLVPAAEKADKPLFIVSTDTAGIATEPLFDASFKTLDWEPQALEKWRGKYVVAYFWATWCVPCRNEVPHLIQLHERYQDDDLVVIGIAIDNADKVAAFAEEFGITYPILVGGNDALNLSKKLGNNIGGMPFTIIVNPDGKALATLLGTTPDGKLEELLEPHLG